MRWVEVVIYCPALCWHKVRFLLCLHRCLLYVSPDEEAIGSSKVKEALLLEDDFKRFLKCQGNLLRCPMVPQEVSASRVYNDLVQTLENPVDVEAETAKVEQELGAQEWNMQEIERQQQVQVLETSIQGYHILLIYQQIPIEEAVLYST